VKDEAYAGVNVVVHKAPDGEMRISRAPLPAMSPELKAIVEEMK
jgi:hypothetical protein